MLDTVHPALTRPCIHTNVRTALTPFQFSQQPSAPGIITSILWTRRLKTEVWNSIQVSLTLLARDPTSTWTISHRGVSKELGQKQSRKDKNQCSNPGCWHHKVWLNPLCQLASECVSFMTSLTAALSHREPGWAEGLPAKAPFCLFSLDQTLQFLASLQKEFGPHLYLSLGGEPPT